MRCSHPERACTFVFTTLLFILSFTATPAESADVHDFRARHAWRKRAALDGVPTGLVASITSEVDALLSTTLPTTLPTSLPTSLPSLSSPSPPSLSPSLSPPSLPSLQTSGPTTTSSSSDSSTPSPTSTPSTTPTTSTTTSQTQASPTSHETSLSLSSYQPSSSQHSSSATSSTSTPAAIGAAPLTAQASVTGGYTGPVTSSPTGATVSATPSSTSSSDPGFFSNTGAVAGTFTVAGLCGVAGIIGVGMLIARRRSSRPHEDDMEYLEKNPEPPLQFPQSSNFVVGDIEESSDLSHASHSMEVTVPPAAHFYPQDDVYIAHGQTMSGSDGYENQGYYPHEAYIPQEYGIAYPPRDSFAAEDAYGGMAEVHEGMPNPFDDAATELPAASQHSNQQLRTITPPLTAYLHRSVDSFYGSSGAGSHGHAI